MAKKRLCTMGIALALLFVSGAVIFAQQSWGWNPEGEQCFSLAGVEWYYSTSGSAKTTFKNHNDFGVTVLYTGRSGRQQSLWLDAGAV
ncbi:MAG: hypothetical protein LBF83_05795, partial [Spirochaetaceae bacterium]|nr:hypothetical protein [Spirochaetaceae bacterium]